MLVLVEAPALVEIGILPLRSGSYALVTFWVLGQCHFKLAKDYSKGL